MSEYKSSSKNTKYLRRVLRLSFQKQPLEVFCKKGVLRNFEKLIKRQLCQSLYFNKVAGLRRATLLK